jgi:hypothetical protein
VARHLFVFPRFTNDSRFSALMIVVLSSVSPLRFLSALRAFAVNNPVEGQDASQDHSANKKARREVDAEPCPGLKAKTPRAVQSTASTPRRAALFRAWPEVPRDGLANRLIHRRIRRQTQPTFALSHTKLEFVNKIPE